MIKNKIKAKSHFHTLLVGAASATALMGSIAQAQGVGAENEKQGKADKVEVIEVKGFRSSLTKSLNMKRLSKNIVDGIASEDIGKSADQNIAEALQRVTGISINRQDGEGTTITARGVQSSLNVTTLNGVPLSDSSNGGGVNFSEFSSDILNSIEVQKTPSASTDEGSLGASIKLSGFKPLDAKKDRRVFELQGRKNDFADSDDYKAQLSLSEKFLDETVGLSIVATHEEQGTRRDLVDMKYYRTIRPPVGATNMETGEVVKTWDYDGDGVEEPLELRQAHQYNFESQTIQRDRDSIAATLQLRPWENGELKFDATYSSQDVYRDKMNMATTPERNNFESQNIIFDPNNFTVVSTLKTALTNEQFNAIKAANPGVKVPGKAKKVGTIRNARSITDDKITNKVLSFSYDHYFDNIDISLRGGHSETDKTPIDQLAGFFKGNSANSENGSGVQNGYHCGTDSSGLLCELSVTPGYMDNSDGIVFGTFQNTGSLVKDVSDSFYADLVWNTDFGPITSIETGFKWNSRSKEINSFWNSCGGGCVGDELSGDTLTEYSNGATSGDVGKELGLADSEYTDGWPIWDIETTKALLDEKGLSDKLGFAFTDRGSKVIEQDILAAYAQANFELMDGRITGDFGLRVAKTKVEGKAASTFTYNTGEDFMSEENIEHFGSREAVAEALGLLVGDNGDPASRDTASRFNKETYEYTNVLPSLNVNYAAAEDVIVRFAASQTIARPPFDKLAPNFDIRENIYGEFSSGNLGEVRLDPYKSTNLDISAEWYFNPSSLLSVAIFNKDLSDYFAKTQKKYYWQDIRSHYYDDSGIVDPTSDRAPKKADEDVTFDPISSEILLPFSDGDGQVGCMPNREDDLIAPDSADSCDVALINGGRNGTGGYVRGIEVALQHNFDYLDGFMSGFGAVINYTYADSGADEEFFYSPDGKKLEEYIPKMPFQNTSEHTVNTTAFWEQDGKLIRLAYNYRTDYLLDRTKNEYGAHWIDGFGSLDLSGSWQINEWASINIQASNLLDTVRRVYSTTRPNVSSNLPGESSKLGKQDTSRTVALSNTGTIYRLGVRLNF